jgi:hypothetical protein
MNGMAFRYMGKSIYQERRMATGQRLRIEYASLSQALYIRLERALNAGRPGLVASDMQDDGLLCGVF